MIATLLIILGLLAVLCMFSAVIVGARYEHAARGFDVHADRAMEIVRDDWREWEREVAQ